MGLNLSVELLAQNDPVLAISRQHLLLGIARIPDSSFRHEIESRTMNDHCPLRLRVRAEKDGRAEDSLERRDQAPVLRTALLQQEDRNQAILSPRQSVAQMT